MSWNERVESAAEMLARVGARASQRGQTEARFLYELWLSADRERDPARLDA